MFVEMYQLGTSLNTNGQSHNIYGTRLDSLAQESPFPEFLFRTLRNLTAGWKMKQTVSKIYPGCVWEQRVNLPVMDTLSKQDKYCKGQTVQASDHTYCYKRHL